MWNWKHQSSRTWIIRQRSFTKWLDVILERKDTLVLAARFEFPISANGNVALAYCDNKIQNIHIIVFSIYDFLNNT